MNLKETATVKLNNEVPDWEALIAEVSRLEHRTVELEFETRKSNLGRYGLKENMKIVWRLQIHRAKQLSDGRIKVLGVGRPFDCSCGNLAPIWARIKAIITLNPLTNEGAAKFRFYQLHCPDEKHDHFYIPTDEELDQEEKEEEERNQKRR